MRSAGCVRRWSGRRFKAGDLTGTLIGRTPSGQPAPHEMFRVAAARADLAGGNWARPAPPDVMKIEPKPFSRFPMAAVRAGAAAP